MLILPLDFAWKSGLWMALPYLLIGYLIILVKLLAWIMGTRHKIILIAEGLLYRLIHLDIIDLLMSHRIVVVISVWAVVV